MGMPFGPDRSGSHPGYEEQAREQELEAEAVHDREEREAEKREAEQREARHEPPQKASWWRRMFGGAAK